MFIELHGLHGLHENNYNKTNKYTININNIIVFNSYYDGCALTCSNYNDKALVVKESYETVKKLIEVGKCGNN